MLFLLWKNGKVYFDANHLKTVLAIEKYAVKNYFVHDCRMLQNQHFYLNTWLFMISESSTALITVMENLIIPNQLGFRWKWEEDFLQRDSEPLCILWVFEITFCCPSMIGQKCCLISLKFMQPTLYYLKLVTLYCL